MQPITNPEILDFIDKLLEKSDEAMKALQEREKMNNGFRVLMDNEYGEDGWNDVDLRNKRVMTDEEVKKNYYLIKNHNMVERVKEIEDVEIVEEDKTDEVVN